LYASQEISEASKRTMGKGWKLAVKRSATGLGLFAQEPIASDSRIIEYMGPVLTFEEADRKGGKYLMTIDEKYIIDGSPRSNTARYINHSCRPNAQAYTSGVRVWIWSLRAIKAGEEITMNYGEEYFKDHIEPNGCKCRKCASGQREKSGRGMVKTPFR
jgi:SET domain-containing protein